jgi:ABC-type oligopeptide transport system substrate-binding subunit
MCNVALANGPFLEDFSNMHIVQPKVIGRSESRNRFAAKAMLLLVIAFAFCSCAERNLGPQSVLNRGLTSDPDSLDPHIFTSNQSATVLYDLGEGLISFDREGRLEGGAASQWAISEDGLTYTFFLRPNLKWSNGESLTAQDFARSFKRLLAPQTASPYSHMLSAVIGARPILQSGVDDKNIGISVPDRHTLVIELENPLPYFLQLLSHPSTFPVYTADNDHSRNQKSTSLRVTNGAYRLVEREINSSLKLVKNIHYWNSANTTIETVVFHVVNQDVEPIRYRAGEIDVTDNVSEVAFASFKAKRSTDLRVAPMLGVYYIGLNLTTEPFRDRPNLRAALSLAIDRQGLVENVLGRGEFPAFGLVPPGVASYEVPKFEFAEFSQSEREELARQMLVKAGGVKSIGPAFELRYNTGGGHEKIAVAIQAMWHKVLGIQVALRAEEFKVFISNVRDMRETQAYRLSWTGDYNDPVTFLQLLETKNSSNLTGYSSEVVDKYLELARSETDIKVRSDILRNAERSALADYPLIPIYYYVSKHLVSSRVIGWSDNVLDIHLSRYLSLQP